MGALASSSGRISCGFLLDKFNYQILITLFAVINTVIIATIEMIAHYKVLFLLYYALSIFLYGGMASMTPPQVYKTFGAK
jgi:hypothetical protein